MFVTEILRLKFLIIGFLTSVAYCSAISRRSNPKGTQAVLLVCVQKIVQEHYCSADSISRENNPKYTPDNNDRKEFFRARHPTS